MKLFRALFKKPAPAHPNCNLLTAKSPKENDPPKTLFHLWDHQRAMVKRCREIESSVDIQLTVKPSNLDRYKVRPEEAVTKSCVGIMCDPPGSGKTFVALAMLALDKTPTLNMLVVPPNLHHQWVDAIKTYFEPGSFKWITITEYADTVQLWKSNSAFKDVRLVITSTMFVEPVASALSSLAKDMKRQTIIDRVIVDEVDTATTLFHTIPSCNRVWFMSASFDPVKHRVIGPFDFENLPQEEVMRLICRCDPGFIQCSQNIEEPVARVITVPDGDIMLFRGGVLEAADITYLNALNFKKVKTRNTALVSADEAGSTIEYARALLAALEREFAVLCEIDESKMYGYKAKYDQMKLRMDTLRRNIETWCASGGIAGKTKLDKVRDLCASISEASDTKWIFFSDDDAIFDHILPIFRDAGIKYATMDEGTIAKTEAAIQRYKTNPDTRALFINSMRDGCGLNLENTTHIVFLHYTNPHMAEQVIGRAQRPGRTCRLEVICLYHENEAPAVI